MVLGSMSGICLVDWLMRGGTEECGVHMVQGYLPQVQWSLTVCIIVKRHRAKHDMPVFLLYSMYIIVSSGSYTISLYPVGVQCISLYPVGLTPDSVTLV